MNSRFQLIESVGDLQDVISILRKEKQVAFDLEGEFNLHRFGMHLCLVQLSNGRDTWLIDPLAITDARVLYDLLADPSVTKICHGPQSDIVLLDMLYKSRVKNVFDTEKAAQLLGYEKTSLTALLEKHYGIVKNQKLRENNWTRRPLSDKMKEYAALDVSHLIGLAEILRVDLEQAGRLTWQDEENKLLEKVRFIPKKYPYYQLKGASRLRTIGRKILHCIFEVREKAAAEFDKPPAYVIRNEMLVELARKPPKNAAAWAALTGVHPKLKKFATAFDDAVKRGRNSNDDSIGGVPAMDENDNARIPKNRKKYNRVCESMQIVQKAIQEQYNIAPMIISNKTIHRLACGISPDFLRKWQWKVIQDCAENQGLDLSELIGQ